MASNITIENARILFRNFSGVESRFNPAGRRNFCVALSLDVADSLKADGWNVKFLQPREEGDEPMPYLQIAVSYSYYPPKVFIVTSGGKTLVDESMINMLDWSEIEKADIVIRPYTYEAAGRSGIKAYLKSLYVTLVEDEFDSKYADLPMR